MVKCVDIVRGKEQLAPFLALFGSRSKFCGGFIRYACSPNTEPALAGDLDCYPNNMEDYDAFKSELTQMGYKPFESAVASSYYFESGPLKGAIKLQVIKPINAGAIVASGTMDDIINSFDFTVVRIGIPANSTLSFAWADDDFLQDELHKNIRIKNIHCPISAIKRIAKYVNKGYTIKPFELLKLYEDWDKRTPEYKTELVDGLKQMKDARVWWEIDAETRDRIQTILYVD